MSLPPELRVLCFQLSSTPTSDLPRLTPTLLRHVLRCQTPLSTPAGNTPKADAPASSVLVHKLKTQLSALLNGKSPEGRFTAVVLIKAVVEVGGWEILQGAEAWVRGMLTLLGKPDSFAAKELCIIALTKIYCMTHPYQTLMREITTPTLPSFITSCLNLVSPKSSGKAVDAPSSLRETIFRSFSMLLPRHTTIYRPFTSQIRLALRPFLAPTSSDDLFVSKRLVESSQRLAVLLHQTTPKNAGGEEWGKAVRGLVQSVHETADQVFRAVIEDWESAVGYSPKGVDVNRELHGGGKAAEDLAPWTGIHAGVERITGLLELLAEYFRSETSTPVAIPLASLFDLATRMLSIAIPLSHAASSNGHGTARLHPAIDRDEREGLWSGLPQIYVAAVHLINTIAERMEGGFLSIAQSSLDQLAWVFQFGKHSPAFRTAAYTLAAKTLFYIGQSFDRAQVGRLSGMIRSCCKDLLSVNPHLITTGTAENSGRSTQGLLESSNHHNADNFLKTATVSTVELQSEPTLIIASEKLLPLILSHVPQQLLDVSVRSMVERTAILTHSKGAMLASILNPFVGKNGKAMTSILPHLTREFGNDDVVEILLRPRMPLLPSASTRVLNEEGTEEDLEDEDMAISPELGSIEEDVSQGYPIIDGVVAAHHGLGSATVTPIVQPSPQSSAGFGYRDTSSPALPSMSTSGARLLESASKDQLGPKGNEVEMMDQDEESSGNESVHLTMQLDTDSDSDE